MDTEELEVLSATERPRNMVPRANLLLNIERAIYDPGEACRVVTIEGAGGLGKTRALEEVLRRLGHKPTVELYGPLPADELWPTDTIAFCDPIDFTDVKIHTREYFMQVIGNSENWHPPQAVLFDAYADQLRLWQRLINIGSAYTEIKGATEKTQDAFWDDFKSAAANRRLVLLLDTTEQLAITSSEWLLDRGLITPKDTAFATPRWLLDSLEEGNFKNTTLIIAGRDKEGARFFDALRESVARAGAGVQHIPIHVRPFSLEETRAYFYTLIADVAAGGERALGPAVGAVCESIVHDEDRLRVLHLYTGGQPVALAIYLDILVEGGLPPDPMQDTPAEAMERLGISEPVDLWALEDSDPRKRALDEAQKTIVRKFIRILFHGSTGLQPLVLQAMARCTRGLDEEQLHYLLHSEPNEDIAAWRDKQQEKGRLEQLAEIRSILEKIRSYSIVRAKPGGRFGLQDEVYRIYAELMTDEETLPAERKERERLYRRLRDWAALHASRLEDERRELVQTEVKGISPEVPNRATHVFIVELTPSEEFRRQQLAAALLEAELEHLHYSLLLEPEHQLNELYYQIVIAAKISQRDEPRAAMFQAEMWRLLQNEYLLPFVRLSERGVVRERGERAIDVLRRAARQDDAVQWILNLLNARQYDRAIELAEAIDRAVSDLEDANEKRSWNHTLARADRACWREYARIYRARSSAELEQAVKTLEDFAAELEILGSTPQEKEGSLPGRSEYGFQGHPAEERLKFVLSRIYNNRGYGLVSLGKYSDAARAYTHSLMGFREIVTEQSEEVQAVTLNNLSRALAELGKIRAIDVCQDGLELRMKQGVLGSTGPSFNTLALIWNDFRRPQQALDYGQKALAIGKFVGDPRLRGLALLQVGETLRRIASRDANPMSDSCFREAERALMEAKDLFIDGELRDERIRSIETYMELGSLYRDWTRHVTELKSTYVGKQRLRSAHDFLDKALAESKERRLFHLELDARVNLAQAQFYAKQYDAAEAGLEQVKVRVTEEGKRQFEGGKPPPMPEDSESFVLKQLSKLHNLRGEMAFERYFEDVEALMRAHPDWSRQKRQQHLLDNPGLQDRLKVAADAYTLSTAYAQLYAPGSELLSLIYTDLYRWLKKLNVTEMRWFYRCESEARNTYGISDLNLANEGDLEDFLKDCFGDFYEKEKQPASAVGADKPTEAVTE